MRLYRAISAEEVINLFKGQTTYECFNKGNNTHGYDKNKDYRHFFLFSKDAEIFFNIRKTSYINTNPILYMIINIPYDIAKKYFGYGIYASDIPGTDFIPAPEFAIPTEELKPEYIVDIAPTIHPTYKNDEDFKKYIDFLVDEIERYDDQGENLAYHLLDYDLTKLINMEIDDRTEDQIANDNIKKKILEF